MLIKDVVERYKGRVRFVSQNWGNSKLAERYGIKRYPVVFVDEALVVRPDDFGGWGTEKGKYHPWRDPASHERFKADLSRMIDLSLQGRTPQTPNAPAQTAAVAELSALPALDARDIEGRPVNAAALSGHVVIVEFWATWCAPCRSTLGWLGEIKRRHGDQVEVLTVAVESEAPEVRTLIASLAQPLRVVMGTDALAARFGGIHSVPTMFVFDREGKTASVFYGAPEDLHAKAERLLRSLLR